MNPRITKRERGLLKGAIRRVFARSELRNSVVKDSIMKGYTDVTRPRVKTWCYCPKCETPIAKSYIVVDHIEPVVSIDETFEEMSIDYLIDKIWCLRDNLIAICKSCHDDKTKMENKERRLRKKERSK